MTNKYEIETEFLQEIADILCDRISLQRVTVRVSGQMARLRGQCVYDANLVRINAKIASCADVDDTLRHEVAHMYSWRILGHKGHGAAWKHACSITGATPSAKFHLITEDEHALHYRYKYVCGQGCVTWAHRIRPRWERGTCRKHGSKYSREKVLTQQSAIV